MYNKILVPLDGSKFSECSLAHVKAIATGCKVPEVILLRVVEPLSSNEIASALEARGELLTQLETSKKEAAKNYLAEITRRMKEEGMPVSGDIMYGMTADAILDYADRNQVDLIIMSTHGRAGGSRWAFGSAADRVIRHSKVPVLSVSPPGCRENQ
jgi:nucleotide-binding universal stress UspA family protein